MCERCDRLVAENRDLREELAEWRRQGGAIRASEADQESEARWRLALKASRRIALTGRVLARRAGRLVRPEAIVAEASPAPDEITDPRQSAGVAICQLRQAMRAVGLRGGVETVRGIGWRMSEEMADVLNGLTGEVRP